ncbi:acVLRF1 family peptidyl-tRNA hydrolase [Specibacter sp. NPDC057265]|uniref:acVLRF1 family peptidyl-tRNA hydrolase n=1 Tax=Specibacter sp. NPDC057265 TaxID=3346075 RepID=UPI003644504C
MNPARRTTFVPAERLGAWVGRFCAAHGGLAAIKDGDDGVMVRTHDGTVALLAPPWPDDGRPGRGVDLLERLASLAAQERRLAVLLARRGGYAVGVAAAGKLLAHKVGSASVRSRGADQAAALVQRAAQEAAKVLAGGGFEYVATGGDKVLVDKVLDSPALASVRGRPRLAPVAVPEPGMKVLQQAAADFCAVRVTVIDAAK